VIVQTVANRAMRTMCQLVLLGLMLLGAVFAPRSVVAQSYPSRLVELVVPFSGGSSPDIMARVFAEALGTELKQPVLVINRDGASGTIAFGAVAAAMPDGYTLLFAPQGQLTIQPHIKSKLAYAFDTFQPICQVFDEPFAIAVGPASRIASLNQLIALARAKPKSLTFGTLGVAMVPHLQAEALAHAADVAFVHAPYRSPGQLHEDALTGRLDFIVMPVASMRDSKLRPLAIIGDRRTPLFPDVPTARELGVKVSMPGFGGLYAPEASPPEVIDRLADACAKAYAAPVFQQLMQNIGGTASYLPKTEFAKRLAEDSREKGELIKMLGIEAE
jgi:tripartite-type tricarboxylate transporter receptor subunit TctC